MTTPSLELNIRASGVAEVKALKDALTELNGAVGELSAFKNVSALDQVAQEMKGLRADLKEVMGDIKKVMTEGVKGTFQQARQEAQQGGQDLQGAFETSLRNLTKIIAKEGQERNLKRAELNKKAASEAAKEGEQIGANFAQGIEKSSAKVKLAWSTLLGGGVKGSASVNGLDMSKLDEGIAKIKQMPEFAAVTAEAEAAAAKKAEEAWGKFTFNTMGRVTRLLEQQKEDASDKAKAEAAAAKKSEDYWAQSAYRTMLNLNRLYEARRVAESKALLDTAAAQARFQMGPALNNASGRYTLLTTGLEVQPQKLNRLNEALKVFTLNANDAHSAARGLASGFGAMFLTWGNMGPLLAGAALSTGFVQVVKMGSEVQHTFEVIRVLSEETDQAVGGLKAQMLDLARTGPFGPLEIAKAMKTLSLAGLDAKEVSSSIKDVLNFAVAGTTSIEQAADVMTSVATAFKISAQGYNYVGDVISKTAAISKASVESIGAAFKTASVINSQYGASLEDVGTGLALLSNLGIQSTAAGTALRNFYADVLGRTPQVRAALKAIGVDALDSAGKAKPLITIVKDLANGLKEFEGKSQYRLVQNIFSERGGKEAVELLTQLRTKAKEMGTAFDSELERIHNQIVNAAGFMAVSSVMLAQTPLNAMKSVVSSLQASLVEAFDNLQPYIEASAARMKTVFNSAEFQNALEKMVMLVGKLTEAITEHITTLGLLFAAWVGFKTGSALVAVGASIARTALSAYTLAASLAAKETVALAAAQEAEAVASSAAAASSARSAASKVTLLGVVGRLGPYVTAAWLAWEAYSWWTDKSAKNNAQLSGAVSDSLIESLRKEADRLKEVNDAKALGITLDEMKLRNAAQQAQDSLGAETSAAQAAVDEARRNLNAAKSGNSVNAFNVQRRTNELKQAELALDRAQTLETSKRVQLLRQLDRTQSEAQRRKDQELAEAAQRQADAQKQFGSKTLPDRTKLGRDTDFATLADEFRKRAQIIEDGYNTERSLLEQKHKDDLVSEGAYVGRILQINQQEMADLRTEATKNFQAEAAEFEERRKKILGALSGEQQAQALKNLTNEWNKYALGVLAALDKAGNATSKSSQKAVTDIEAETAKLIEQNDRYWIKANASAQKEVNLARTRRDLANATEEVRARAEAEIKVEDQHSVQLQKLQTDLNAAQESLAAFQLQYGDMSSVDPLPPGALDAYQKLQEKANALTLALQKANAEVARLKGQAGDAAELEVQNKKIQELRDGAKSLAKSTAASIVDGLLEGGTSGVKKLRDAVKQAFLNPIRIVLQAFIQPYVNQLVNAGYSAVGLNNATNYGSGTNYAQLSQQAGGALDFFNNNSFSLSNVGSTNNGIGGFFGFTPNAMTSLTATNAATATSGGLTGTAELVGNSATNATGAMSSISSALPYIGALFAAANKQYGQAAGMAIGTMIMPGIGTAIGAVIGGLVDSFSKSHGPKNESAFGVGVPTEFTGNDTTAKGISQTIQQSYSTLALMLGVTNTTLKDLGVFVSQDPNGTAKTQLDIHGGTYNRAMLHGGNIENVGRSPEELQQAIELATAQLIVKNLQDNTTGAVQNYLKAIDITTASLETLKAAMQAVQDFAQLSVALRVFGNTFESLKQLSVDNTEALVQAFGGVSNLTSALGSFYNNFFDATQKHQMLEQGLTTEFEKLGLALPKTRVEFRNLVLAQNLTTDAGRSTFTALLGLADAFAQLTEDANDLTDATKTQAQLDQDVTDARSKLQDVYNDEADRLTNLRDRMQSFTDKLGAFLKELTLGDLAGLTPQQQYFKAKAEFEKFSAGLNSADPLVRDDALSNIEEAGRAFLEASRTMFGASAGYFTDLGEVTSAVQQAKDISQAGVDVANLQLTTLNNMVEGLADIKKTNENGLDALYNVTGSGLAAVVTALGTLQSSILAAAAGPSPSDAATSAATDLLNSSNLTGSVVASVVSGYYQKYLGRAPETEGLAFWSNQYAEGTSLSSIEQWIKTSPESIQHNGGVPLRSGLDRVPYDNFPATLHKDEAVLNAAEAEKRRNLSADQDETIRRLEARLASLESTVAEGLDNVVAASFASTDSAADKVANAHEKALSKSGWGSKVREGAKLK